MKDGEPVKVMMIYEHIIGIEADWSWISPDTPKPDPEKDRIEAFEPIPLTPEILEKCGFNKRGMVYDVFNMRLRVGSRYNDLSVSQRDRKEWRAQIGATALLQPPQYLHELQNLYFALTGTELQVVLP